MPTTNLETIYTLNAELSRLCPFSAQGGTHFQLVPLGSGVPKH